MPIDLDDHPLLIAESAEEEGVFVVALPLEQFDSMEAAEEYVADLVMVANELEEDNELRDALARSLSATHH